MDCQDLNFQATDEPPLQPGDPPASGSNLLQPPIGPPVLQQKPAPAPLDFASFMI